MPDHMPEDMPDRMPNRMSEDMSDRMPEDLPVRKCINVMVGITRSKVIFLLTVISRIIVNHYYPSFTTRKITINQHESHYTSIINNHQPSFTNNLTNKQKIPLINYIPYDAIIFSMILLNTRSIIIHHSS